MNIIISNSCQTPIYEQIVEQIKSQILTGALVNGEMLPSIRNLAKELRISVITTKRAYDELEKENFINTVPGKGCFVAQSNIELIKEENLKKIEIHLKSVLDIAKMSNLSLDEIIKMLRILEEEI